MQTRRHSLVESLTNTAVGYVIAVLSGIAIFPMFGIRVSVAENMGIAAWFTAISILRGYLLRRWFTRKTERTAR